MTTKNTAIVYIHGFGSSPTGDTAVKMGEIMRQRGYAFFTIDHKISDLEYGMQEIDYKLNSLCQTLDEHGYDIILFGCSFGGYIALQWLNITKCLVVNPTLRPWESLKKYDVNPDHLHRIREDHDDFRVSGNPCIVVCGDNDTTVDPDENGRALSNVAHIVELDMGHRLEEKFYETVADLLENLDNTVVETS